MASETAVAGGNAGGGAGGQNGEESRSHWWWGAGGAAQIGLGIKSFLRGCAGDSRFMPLKAFSVASLFVGGAASASLAALQASGIRKVEDAMEVGANIRTSLGVPPRRRTNRCFVLQKEFHYPSWKFASLRPAETTGKPVMKLLTPNIVL